MSLNIATIRREFPLLASGEVIYLDSAATTQKPEIVLQAMDAYYRNHNANPHRGMHALAEAATVAYEDARTTVASFIGAKPYEVVCTKNCTEAINLVAQSWGKQLQKGDTVLLSMLEHHSNIVPWLQLKELIGINIEWIGIDDNGLLKMDDLDCFLETNTVKLVSVTGLSNVLGTRTPLEDIAQKAHAAGAKVLVDAAQLVAHAPIDVQKLNCDFLTFSGHKLYGPTGIGALYAKHDLLQKMPPFLGGGMMIGEVTTDTFTAADAPTKFEAGTPPVAEAVGLAAAIDWMNRFAWEDISRHEEDVLRYALSALQSMDGVHVLGAPDTACISFTVDNVHPHDLTEIIGRNGVCMRAGHHCAQPLHTALGVGASTRLSLGIYNTKEDIDTAVDAMTIAITTLR